jgi:hypothetical protein
MSILAVMDEVLPQLLQPFPPTERYLKLAMAFRNVMPIQMHRR